MKRDTIDFGHDSVSALFRRMFAARLLVGLFPLFPLRLGAEGIWLAMPISEFLTLSCAAVFFLKNR